MLIVIYARIKLIKIALLVSIIRQQRLFFILIINVLILALLDIIHRFKVYFVINVLQVVLNV